MCALLLLSSFKSIFCSFVSCRLEAGWVLGAFVTEKDTGDPFAILGKLQTSGCESDKGESPL